MMLYTKGIFCEFSAWVRFPLYSPDPEERTYSGIRCVYTVLRTVGKSGFPPIVRGKLRIKKIALGQGHILITRLAGRINNLFCHVLLYKARQFHLEIPAEIRTRYPIYFSRIAITKSFESVQNCMMHNFP